jgi:hypothetical protein
MIVVNFATNGYKSGQERLKKSLEGKALFVGFTDYSQIKSPSHQASPYEFKIHAIDTVMNAFPQEDIFLWLDSSVYLVGDISKVKHIIKETGYFMEGAGHYVNDWCNQFTRRYFNLRPEENYTMYSAGITGLNRQSEVAMEFLRQWRKSAKAGCFKGKWEDHRHDMTCASIIASRLGMTYQPGGLHASYIGEGYGTPNPEAVFYLQGMP